VDIPVPYNMEFLESGKVLEGTTNFYSLMEEYNDSKKGKYRYIFYVYHNKTKDHSLGDRYKLIVEFEIK
jgi:hypothetical protein